MAYVKPFVSACGLALMGLTMAQSASIASTAPSAKTAWTRQNTKGVDLLFRALERSRKIRVEAIVVRQVGRDQQMQLKMQQAYGGAMRMTILSPLSQQGIISFDDGKEWRTYLPDENRLLIQPSPRAKLPSAELRQRLAAQNYAFDVDEARSIAGRETLEIKAKPKFPGMPERCFFVDAKTLFLLRTDVDSKTTMDTRKVEYPARMSADDLAVKPLREVREMRMEGPKSMNVRDLQKELGFTISIPKNIPLGFMIVDTQLTGRDHKMAAIRMTDGLATMTVYQSDEEEREDRRRSPGAVGFTRSGVKMQAMGDLPIEMLRRILEAFLKGLQAQAGSPEAVNALNRAMESGVRIILVAP